MRRRHWNHRNGFDAARGFVLPVTVVMLALVSVGVVMMSHRSDELRALVLAAREEQQASQVVDKAVAEALFLTSALHRRGDSMNTIRLDGRFYKSASGALVSYQDAGALFNLHRSTQLEFSRLLNALDISDPTLTDKLADQLLDFADTDKLQRLNGAEEPEYLAAGLPPPRDNRLNSPRELERLPAWQDLTPEQRQRVFDNVFVGTQRTVNKFTVTAPVLAAVGQADPGMAKELVAQRLPGTMVRIESLPTIAGGSYLAESRFITAASATMIVTICVPTVSWCQHMAVTSSGESLHAPWHVGYSYRLPRSRKLPADKDVTPLPDQLPDKPPPPLFSPFANSFP